MSLLLKTYAELYIISFPYAFILFFFLALLTKRPRFYHQIFNNFKVFCNRFRTISPLFGQILITCFKNSKACLSSFSYSKTCSGVEVVECLSCIVPAHRFILLFFRIYMPVISATANLMEVVVFAVSLYFLSFSYLHFLREQLSSNLFWKNFCFNFRGKK